jgi:thiamine pyrophosphate-dependent acetolactate synthase large subunit-like protein
VAPSPPNPSVADTVGATIASLGVTDAFGILGSGNLVVTNALTNGGARFHHARHEGGAITMADGFARVTGRVAVCSVHQGPGLTNTMTGLAEAAKSRTPVLVLAGETPAAALTSNFRIDQHDLVESVGAVAERLHSPNTAAADAQRAYERANTERRPVVLMLPIDIQAQPAVEPPAGDGHATQNRPPVRPPAPAQESIAEAAALIANASRPAIIAGRGAVITDAGAELAALADKIGAVLATSAPANGLFAGLPYALGISGGFSSPKATEILSSADLMIAFGASLNHWTTKHGALIDPDARLIQVDIEPGALGRNRPAHLAIVGDARTAALKLSEAAESKQGWRTRELEEDIAKHRWQTEPYEDASTDEYIDPRTLTRALNDRLPDDRIVAVDSGHFTGYPAMYLDVPDARNWIFANGFQAVGLGLGNAIGAAIAKPDTTTVAALGDGGAFLSLAELETAARLKLGNLLVVIYDDSAYGAEVHHFAPMGHDVSKVRFPDVDLAEIAQAAGAKAQTVINLDDLAVIDAWLADRSGHPLVLDAKVNPTICAEWLEEAFRAG